MNPSPELQPVSPHTAIWHTYDPAVKADLYSTVLSTPAAVCIIDPIAVPAHDLSTFAFGSQVAAIVVTNHNHWRASASLAAQLSVNIFANHGADLREAHQKFIAVNDGDCIANGFEVIAVEGAAPGEIALYSEIDGGSLVVGDALINFEPYGFTFLPAKYCDDHRKMKRSLRRLLEFKMERMFFAHGTPITNRASARLRALLEQ